MWPFKKHYPTSWSQLNVVTADSIPIGLDKFFAPKMSKLMFCYAADWFTTAYGAGCSEGRHQVYIFKTLHGNFVRVCQEAGEKNPQLMGEVIEEGDVRNIYFEVMRSKELGVRNICILRNELNYGREEL